MSELNRRQFVAASGAVLAASVAGAASGRFEVQPPEPAKPTPPPPAPPTPPAPPPQPAPALLGDKHRGKVIISSANGLPATGKAMELLGGGMYLLDALVAGVKLVEDDPNDDSVGYGGLPNEEGIVELDASCMDGRLHRAGSVGALRNIKNPAAVALQLMRRTDHVMLVGSGALQFAKQMGFKEEDLLTEKAREEWLKWKANLNREDWWLNDDQQLKAESGPAQPPPPPPPPAPTGGTGPTGKPSSRLDTGDRINGVRYTTGTIHCSAVTGEGGDLCAVTSTSGLSWKLPGRLGDSPIVGAGMYCDNAIGSAGATGRGESVTQVCGAFSIVQHMEAGLSPTEACLAVLKRLVDRTKIKRLLDDKGRPIFSVQVYAVRKDGAYGSASIWSGKQFAVNDGNGNRHEPAAFLFETEKKA